MKDPSPRQARAIEFLSQFDITWTYEKGSHNTAADFFSRPNDIHGMASTSAAITLDHIGPPEWSHILKSYEPTEEETHNLQPKRVQGFWFDTSTGQLRLLVPPPLRRPCFDQVHQIAHFGIKKTLRSLKERFMWPNMKADTQRWCLECQRCQAAKSPSHKHRTPVSFLSHERFHTVHIDIVGPLPPSKSGKQYLLTMIDRFTRWVEAVPITNISAEQCAVKFLEHWVCRYGVPVTIISDQGTQFESALFNTLLQHLGIQRQRTTAYHPQSNGAIERAHRTIKQCLRAIGESNTCWEDSLPLVLFAMRTSVNESTQFPPSQLVFGGQLRAPADLLFQTDQPTTVSHSDFFKALCAETRRYLSAADLNQPSRAPSNIPTQPSWVWLQQPNLIGHTGLKLPYTGPYQVIRQEEAVITLDINGKHTRVNVDRVKPALVNEQQGNTENKTTEPKVEKVINSVDEGSSTTELSRYGRQLNYRFGTPKYVGRIFTRSPP
jgi:transposase InsO family protein